MIAKFIRDGLVEINGKKVFSPKRKIDPLKDTVTFDKEKVFFRENLVLMMNKPSGYESSDKDGRYPSVQNLVNEPYSRLDIHIAGRLDADATGMLLLTNSGGLLHKIISPTSHIGKKYLVRLQSPLKDVSPLLKGVTINDGKGVPFLTKPAIVEKLDDFTCEITIQEGKFHQVKRMFEAINNEVVNLKRIAIGNLSLDNTLPEGAYRELSTEEVNAVFEQKTSENGPDMI